jgi:hypothetical protein
MTTMSSREVVDYLRLIRSELLAERQRLTEAQAAEPGRLQAVSQDEESAWAHLLGTLVPDLNAQGLDRAAARLSLPLVAAKATGARRLQRQRQLQAQLAKIEGEVEYQNRENLLNEADIRLPDLEENAAPLRADVQLLSAEPLWDELINVNYGTPAYTRKWYQRGYFRHWKFGDRILAQHGARLAVRDFGALRTKYLGEKQALETFEAEVRLLQERSARIRAMAAEHDEAGAALANLDAWVLAQTRALVLEHLSALSLPDLTPLLQDDPGLLLAAKRIHGAQAKQKYMDAVSQEWLVKPLADVQRRLSKVDSGIEKFCRPKNATQRYPREEIEAKYGIPSEKWGQRWDRYENTTQEIVVFNDYGRVDPFTQFLWWDLMIHSHHGNFVPDVCDYHQHHAHPGDVYADASANDDLRMHDAS